MTLLQAVAAKLQLQAAVAQHQHQHAVPHLLQFAVQLLHQAVVAKLLLLAVAAKLLAAASQLANITWQVCLAS